MIPLVNAQTRGLAGTSLPIYKSVRMSASTPITLLDLIRPIPSERTAIIIPETGLRVTYGALTTQVEAVAGALAGAGITRGARVGMALPNGLPTIVAFLAASMAGTAAPLNPSYKEDEFRFFLDDTDARVLLVPPAGAPGAAGDGGDNAAKRAAGDRIPVLTIDADATGRVTVAGGGATRAYQSPTTDDVALILHTSGSTGRPKRVPLSHANLSISAANVARSYALGPTDVAMCVMPLFHVHGLVASTLATLSTGGTVVVPGKFNPLSFWRIARDHGVTWYSAVPTLHQLLVARASASEGRPPGSRPLRLIRSAAMSLTTPIMLESSSAFGAPVLEAYGMTEAAHQMSTNPLPPA